MRAVVLAVVVSIALAGCAGSTSDTTAATGSIVVYAAASLTDSFGELARDFEAAHPGVTVSLDFGGSASLAEQLAQGAPGDVFAAANPATMAIATKAGVIASTPQDFASNILELVVPKGNPAGITGLKDLARPELTIALCAPSVPCGAAAARLLALDGITAAPDTLEQDVKGVLTKVELGEVDAGLIYRTDVLAGGAAVEGIPVPDAAKVVNRYPIVAVKGSGSAATAKEFLAFVLSGAGRAVLARWGFGAP